MVPLQSFQGTNTFDGTNPGRKPPGMYQTPVNNGINYQPQQVSRISSMNSINFLGEYIIYSLFSFLKPPIRFPLTAVARRLISAAVTRIFGSFFVCWIKCTNYFRMDVFKCEIIKGGMLKLSERNMLCRFDLSFSVLYLAGKILKQLGLAKDKPCHFRMHGPQP